MIVMLESVRVARTTVFRHRADEWGGARRIERG
jgi:hypothetical protein